MVREYVAFISYQHSPLSIAVAKKLLRLIEGYVVPKSLRPNRGRKLGSVFRDRDELVASGDLSSELKEALDRSEYLIVICTPESTSSRWMELEISYFLQKHSRKNLLTVLASGTPDTAFPNAIACDFPNNIEDTTNIQPSEIDIRAKNIRSTLAKLRRERFRIFAALLHCPYDVLVQRNQKRILSISAAIAAISLSVTILLLWQNHRISQQNIELTQQREQILYRESQLLTQKAENSLEEGNSPMAIRSAIAALPGRQEPDRPYYAPAEALLFDGLNIFHTNNHISQVYDTVLEQETPVEDFCISDDGTKVITVDAYGTMNCFDAESSELLWSVYTQESLSGNQQLISRVFFCGSENKVIGYYSDNLTCHDLATGKRFWHHDMGNTFPGYLFYNSERDILIYASYETNMDLDLTAISFHVLSGKTGAVVKDIPFTQSENIEYCRLTSHLFSYGNPSHAGVFSSDGRLFAGIYAERTQDWQSWKLKCFIIDVDSGMSHLCFEETIPGHYDPSQIARMQFTDGDLALSWVFLEDADAPKITASKLNLQSGELVWKTSIPCESSLYGLPVPVLYWSNSLFISNGNWLYRLSPRNGELLDSRQLLANITELKTISNYSFAFVLNDGTYAIGWCNASGLHLTTDSGLGVTVDFGQYEQMKIWRGGILQLYLDENEIEISCSQKSGPGYVAFIPLESTGNQVGLTLRRVSKQPKGADRSVVFKDSEQIGVDDLSYMDAGLVYSDADIAVLGPFEGDAVSYYVMLDLAAQTVLKLFEVDKSSSEMCFAPFSDGSGYIQYTQNGEVLRHVNGEEERLAVAAEKVTNENGHSFYSDWLETSDSIYLEGTKAVLTVKMGETHLQIWKNGAELQPILLPPELVLDPQQLPEGRRYIYLTAKGRIFMRGFNSSTISDVRMFDLNTNIWSAFNGTVSVPNWDAIAIADSATLCAVADAQDIVRVMNYATGEVVSSFPLNLSCNAISQMQFLLDNEYLAIMTEKGNNMLVYSIATGDIVLRHLFSGIDGTKTVTVTPDDENQRVYFSCHHEGLCVDLTSWTKLSEIHDMIFFDPVHGVLYQTDITSTITACKVPSTSELIEKGEEYLHF